MKQSVNYIRHLNDFYNSLQENNLLHANHISLYHALFRLWNKHHFENPITVRKDEILALSRIGSKSTYNKCLRQLDELKYISYKPAKVPYLSTIITMLPLARNGTLPDQNCPTTHTEISPHIQPGFDPDTGPILDRYITKQLNSYKTESQTGHPRFQKPEETVVPPAPGTEDVKAFFLAAGQTSAEATKFFYHNQAIGWLLSGQPILDWKAAAYKWIENTSATKPTQHAKSPNNGKQQQSITETKDYSQPL